MNNSLNILKIIDGLNKSLNIANQIIPIYKKVKPILDNGNDLISSFQHNYNNIKNNNNIKHESNEVKISNSPTFFH